MIMARNAFGYGLLAACDRAPRAIEQYDRIEYDGLPVAVPTPPTAWVSEAMSVATESRTGLREPGGITHLHVIAKPEPAEA
jgi:hypothetical protein